jgi:rod shape-determining protein MreC
MFARGPGQSRFTLAVLVVISITVIALDLLGVGPLGLVRDGVNGALSPVRAVSNAIFGNHDSDEVAALKERVAELEGAEIEAANYQAELRRLQASLGIEVPEGVTPVPATIISSEIGNFENAIEIDQGADQGIEVNMPVVSGGNLVGIVDSVTFNSARILLITDPSVSVGVRHPSGEVGIAHGQGDGQPLVVEDGFDVAQGVADGDPFVTDGPAGSHYPPGLPVGFAVSIEAADTPLEQQVFIDPVADLGTLSQVAVLLYTPSEAGSSEDDEEQAG